MCFLSRKHSSDLLHLKINPFTTTKDKKLTFDLSAILRSLLLKESGIGGTEMNNSKVCPLCSREQIQFWFEEHPNRKVSKE